MQRKNFLKRILMLVMVAVITVSVTVSQLVICHEPAISSEAAIVYNDEYEEFLSVLGKKESGNNYNTRGGSYLGRWQLGRSALQDAGFMTSGGAWTDLAKKFGVTSTETFLNTPAAQDYAVYLVHRKIWSYLKSNGAASYVGKTYKGLTCTIAGLVGAAHLVGPYALKSALASGSSSADGNGITAYTYMKALGGYDISQTITGDLITVEQALASAAGKSITAPSSSVSETTVEATTEASDNYEINVNNVYAYGDLDGDGVVDMKDATFVLIYYSEKLAGSEDDCRTFVKTYIEKQKAEEDTGLTEETTSTEDVAGNATDETTIDETAETSNSEEFTVETSSSGEITFETVNVQMNGDTDVTTETETVESTETSEATETIEATETTEDSFDHFGDVNKDKTVDAKDAVMILRYYANKLAGLYDSIDLPEDATEENTTEENTTEVDTSVDISSESTEETGDSETIEFSIITD